MCLFLNTFQNKNGFENCEPVFRPNLLIIIFLLLLLLLLLIFLLLNPKGLFRTQNGTPAQQETDAPKKDD